MMGARILPLCMPQLKSKVNCTSSFTFWIGVILHQFILEFLLMEVIVFFSSAVVNLIFLSSLQALKGLGNLVKFSHKCLEWQCMHLPIFGLTILRVSKLDICFVVHEMGVCIQAGPYRGFGGVAPFPSRGCEALARCFLCCTQMW